MITDHGVRTLYMQSVQRGYQHESAGNYQSAMSEYNYALTIAKSFDDHGEIQNSNERISRLNDKIKRERSL